MPEKIKKILTVAVKFIISMAVQLLFFFIFKNNGSTFDYVIYYGVIVLSVLLTLFLKVNPPYWIISGIILLFLYDIQKTGSGSIFPGLEHLGLIFFAFTVASSEVIMSITSLLLKKLVVHILSRVKVKLIISDNECNWQKIGINSFFLYDKIRKCCAAALDEEKIKEKAEVSLTIVNNEKIKELNLEHRQKDSVTDVLSFPMSNGEEFDIDPETNRIMLGDIVISAERAVEQAKEYGHSFEREMCFLATHSMFHLLGYDHEISEKEEKIMFEKQDKVLQKLGISR